MSGVRLVTVRSPDALLARYEPSPSKLATTAPGYVPAFRPASEVKSDANPPLSTLASPTGCPFSTKRTVRPVSGTPADVNDATRGAEPPKTPVVADTTSCDDATSGGTA